MARTLRVTVRASEDLLDALSSCLFGAGVGGLEELPDGYTLYVEEGEPLAKVEAALAKFGARVRAPSFLDPLETAELSPDWETTWQAALEPAALGDGFVLRPEHARPAPEGERTLWYAPRQSFGTGDHPTTRLVCRALLDVSRAKKGLSLLDVGSGTGVLSLLALRAGFAHATGVDIEEESVAAGKANAALNGLGERVDFRLGSIEAVTGAFDVVVINIISTVLAELASAVPSRMALGGRLFLSGLLTPELGEVRRCYEAVGLVFEAEGREGEWGFLAFKRP